MLAAAGATAPAKADADKLLYFGTQTAIWNFSDGVKLGDWVDNSKLLGENQYDVVKKVHDYLVANATDQPEPKAELSVDPASAKATVGEKAGPFTVKGPAGEITVAADGGSAVDAEGKPVTTTTNGGQFWLAADGAGEVKVTVSAQDSVSFGRVFLFTGERAAQKLILGGSTGERHRDRQGRGRVRRRPGRVRRRRGPGGVAVARAPAESPSPSARSAAPRGPVDLAREQRSVTCR